VPILPDQYMYNNTDDVDDDDWLISSDVDTQFNLPQNSILQSSTSCLRLAPSITQEGLFHLVPASFLQ